MAKQCQTNTSFIQFNYCELCRLSHKTKDKHVYSAGHQNIVRNVLQKYVKKIKSAKETRKKPEVHNASWEKGAKFWCYFCKQELGKHIRLQNATVRDGGILVHIACKDHAENAIKFWREHRLDADRRPAYLLSEEDLKRFEEQAAVCVSGYDKEQQHKQQQEAARIRRQEEHRQRVVAYQQQMLGKGQWNQPSAAATSSSSLNTGGHPQSSRKTGLKTVGAKAEGLACIQIKPESESVGNVHSGATPPWLQPFGTTTTTTSSTTSSGTAIGPTMDDWKAHLESETKRKLPATRVGAQNSDEELFLKGGSSTWLPSFGRVWSKNRRSHSRYQFMKVPQSHAREGSNRTAPSSSVVSNKPDHSKHLSLVPLHQDMTSLSPPAHLSSDAGISMPYATSPNIQTVPVKLEGFYEPVPFRKSESVPFSDFGRGLHPPAISAGPSGSSSFSSRGAASNPVSDAGVDPALSISHHRTSTTGQHAAPGGYKRKREPDHANRQMHVDDIHSIKISKNLLE